MPQHRFASVHVVGTNGKTSVAQMTAALLEAHGVSAGAYLSPHVQRWSQRVEIGGREIDPAGFAAAVERTAQSVQAVNRSLAEGDSVTQFEVATAAAFVALAAAGVEVGVIEAGLGGRLDATNVLQSGVCVLTSVGLEHTEWLGETELEITAEKLDVLRPRSTLVVGSLGAELERLAEERARERHATLVRAPHSTTGPPGLRGGYQRRNFSLATEAAAALLGALEPAAVERVAGRLELPGRVEVRDSNPPLVLDAAHNPHGARALAEALPEVAGGRPVVACVALLEGKDASATLESLRPAIDHLICTELPAERLSGSGRPGARSIEARRLADLAERLGLGAEAVPDPDAAVARALEVARERSGLALCTGSHYLLSYP